MSAASTTALRIAAMVRIAGAVIALGLPALLAGCASVPAQNFYTLGAVAAPAGADAANPASGSSVTVDPANIPELVDRPQFVITAGESRVAILEQQRWAEPLKSQIARTVAMNLGRILGTARASTRPPAGGVDADYRVGLDVQRFESRPGEAAILEVLWTVRRAGAPGEKSGRSTLREGVDAQGYNALVAAHGRALASLSREIAAAMRP